MTEQASYARVSRKPWAVGLAVAVCGAATFAGVHGDGERGFSERSIAGTWSYVGQLGLLVPPTAPEPTASATVGQFYFDGKGGCAGHAFVNVLGTTVETEILECSYSVDSDGFGSAEATFTNAPIQDPFPFRFVISDGGRELAIMNTQYVVGVVIAKRR
jgi:hypothetical protein